jgi:hypothetical protein
MKKEYLTKSEKKAIKDKRNLKKNKHNNWQAVAA